MALKSFKFEIHGKVQGVYFRKCTAERAISLGIKGWVKNTTKGTVIGFAEGENIALKNMKEWLEKTGSPKSRVEKAVFTDEKDISSFTQPVFKVIK